MFKQKGLSLVELMISLTLGIVLMTGVVQMFLTSRVTYSTQQAISRIQESGRLAVDFMAQDIRMAGYMGCASRDMTISSGLTGDGGSYLYDFNVGIRGYTAENHPMTGVEPAAGTDVLIVRRASAANIPIVGPTGANANLDVAPDANQNKCIGQTLCTGDIALVTDCTQGRSFRVTNMQDIGGGGTRVVHAVMASQTPHNKDAKLGGEQFPPGSEIMAVRTIAYYIAESNFTPGVRSLWQQVGDNAPVEMIEGVENMSLRYGHDTDGDGVPDTYEAESQLGAAQWADVAAVRVRLLAQSLESNVVPEPQTIEFAGATLAGEVVADRRMRQVFTSTVGIRSRLK